MVLPQRPRWTRILTLSALLLLLASPRTAAASSDVNLDASERVFAVLAAVSLAGLNPRFAQDNVPRAVSDLWAHLRLLPSSTVTPLREFVAQHRQGSLHEDLSRYLSLALLLSDPPEFAFLLAPHELPPDVKEIRGFRQLVKNFYTEADLHSFWGRYLTVYEGEMARLQPDLSQALLRARAYLRLLSESTLGRRYVVFLEWLAPPGLTSARSYGDKYYLVVNPLQGDLLAAGRHQYLHFLVDPLAVKYAEAIGEKADLHELARRAPRLPGPYRNDFLLLTTECLIRAIELRLDAVPKPQVAVRVSELEQQGYVLTRYFLQALLRFEQVEPSFRFYFPELLAALDPLQERERLESIAFALSEERAGVPEPLAFARPEPLLAHAERELTRGNHETARMLFERVLSEYDGEEPRALYGLAVIASVQQDAEQARHYFERTTRVARDPHMLGWTHVYLGRIYDLAGERRAALAQYRAALAVRGISEKIQEAARRGLEAPYRPLLRETQP
ncbi:MAG: hypothetical protein ACE5MH_06580 [Terriglobia bacterium]